MNDPSEADLHDRLQDALGRTPGNPLLVVSQKTVTGHAKGGAAAWQLDGVLRMLDTGAIPGNRNLESVDPLERGVRHLALGDRPIRLAEPPRAALLTSLGFGHVSAVLLVAHPDTFLASVPAPEREDYLRRAGLRRAQGARRRLETRHGRPAPIRRDRPFTSRDAEAAMLLELKRGQTPLTGLKVLGVDLVDVDGFAEQLADAASGFVDATFTAQEQRTAGGDARRLAARFAAKEAFVKAWSGSRYGQPPQLASVDLREIEVVGDGYGRPGIDLHGDVARAVGDVTIHVSLSHDGAAAIAVVVLG